MGKSTISMAIFNSYVNVYQRVVDEPCDDRWKALLEKINQGALDPAIMSMEPRIIQGSSKDHPRIVQTWRKQQAEDVPCEVTKTSPSCWNCLALMDIGVLKGLKHPDCVIHTLEILFDHFPRFFMFFMIFDDCFSNFKALLQISRCFFYELQILDPWQPRFRLAVKRNHMAKATSFSVLPIFLVDLMIGKNQQTWCNSTF